MDNYLAIDIGGSKVMCGIINSNGIILEKERFVLPKAYSEAYLIGNIYEMGARLMSSGYSPAACGIAIPGLADTRNGIWLFAPFSGLADIPIGTILKEKFGIPAYADNDINICALGEKMFGVCRDTRDFLWITVSNGIGGGLVLNGEVYRGSCGGAGEIGRIIVEEDEKAARRCGCGNTGCLEAMASGASISAIFRDITGTAMNAKEIADLAKAGDSVSLSIYRKAAHYIGKAVASCATLLNIEKVVFGGGVSEDFEFLYPMIRASVDRFIFKPSNKELQIVKTQLGYDATLIGCAALAASNHV